MYEMRFLMQQQPNICVDRIFAFTMMYQSLCSVLSAMFLIPFKINATKLNILFCATSINKLPAFLRLFFLFRTRIDKKMPEQTTIIKCTHLSEISWQNYFSVCIAQNERYCRGKEKKMTSNWIHRILLFCPQHTDIIVDNVKFITLKWNKIYEAKKKPLHWKFFNISLTLRVCVRSKTYRFSFVVCIHKCRLTSGKNETDEIPTFFSSSSHQILAQS